MRLLVDMDGVICNFNKTIWDIFERDCPDMLEDFPRPKELIEFYAENTYDNSLFLNTMQSINQEEGFFLELEPIAGAIDALKDLEKDFEVFICTAPLLENSTCCNDKLEWIHQHLGYEWTRRTIISKDKTVIDGDFLIDDKPIITGIATEPIWQRLIFDQPYNKNIVGRRINWVNYREVIDKIW
jgi:5'-nucleotidase